MNRTILLGGAIALHLSAVAQCVPDPLYADSVYGVWPDTTENFAPAVLNVFYSDTLQILVPVDAGLINSAFDGINIDSVALVGVDGLPPGITVSCNSQTSAPCTFLTNQVGCGLLEGVPTAAGVYDMTLNVLAYAFIGFVLPVPQSFTGYRIVVAEDASAVPSIAVIKPADVRVVPNPATGPARIQFTLPGSSAARIKLFNLVGEKIRTKQVMGKQGINSVPIDVTDLERGVYLYTVEAGAGSFTGRLVVN